ncbi:FHA domain-containing protein [bacterium]|nr:FHA domain-containing protein [bacterium]
MSEDTQYVTQNEAWERPFLETGLALQYADGRLVPVVHADISVGERAEAHIDGIAPRRYQVDGQKLVSEGSSLALGDELELGSVKLKLVPLTVTAVLQGLNDDRTWAVNYQPIIYMGRMGRRVNDIELNDKTISRTQARLETGPQGTVLVAESPTILNGQPIEVGSSHTLADGDLIRFGTFVFRYRLGSPSAAQPNAGVKVYCLGGFQVEADGVAASGADWRSHTARFVLAYLASEWPRPVALEPLLEAFWPDLDAERARSNLRVTIHKIRRSLPLPESGPPLFERTTYTLGFHPDLSFWHDAFEFQKALDEKNWRKALSIYRGKFLEECYMDWAEAVRSRLESACLEAGLQLVKETPVGPERLDFARRCLQLDPCCQPAVMAAMETSRLLGRPEEALKLFESFRKTLESTLGMEPSLELLREEQLAKLHVS